MFCLSILSDFIGDGRKIKDVKWGSGIFKRDGKWMVFLVSQRNQVI